MWGKYGTYRTAAYFRDHVINLRFHFSERSEVSLVAHGLGRVGGALGSEASFAGSMLN